MPLRHPARLLLLLLAACDDGAVKPGDSPTVAGDSPTPTDSGPTDSGTGDSGTSGTDSGTSPTDCYPLADGSCVVETWVDMPELEAVDGVYTLNFGPAEVILDGLRHCVRAYNGVYPGPTLVTDTSSGARQIRIDLHNTFAEHDFRALSGDDSCTCTDSAGDQCEPSHGGCDHTPDPDCSCTDSSGDDCGEMYDFNLTNLYAHGSHIWPDFARGGDTCSPDGDLRCRDCDPDACDDDPSDDTCYYSDDVLTEVHPGEGARYRWDIDEDGTHHAGLNWYHPHIHGTTAIQVASGAAGAWVIRGDIDEVPGLANARERVMVLSTPPIGDNGFVPLEDGEACTEETLTFNNFGVLGSATAKQTNLVNGVKAPRIVVAPGQVERWRIVDASFLDDSFFGIFRGDDSSCSSWSMAEADTLQMTQYARDGITMPDTFTAPYWFMSSGYRVEGVIGGNGVLEDGDTWCFVIGRFLQEGEFGDPVSAGEIPSADDIFQLLGLGTVGAIINVTSAAAPATETTPPETAAIVATAPSTSIDGLSAEEQCANAAAVEDPTEVDQVAILQVGLFTADDPDPCGCDNYNVNCHNFADIDRDLYPYDRDLPLNAVERWRVSASADGHPFHIHINPFLACPQENPFDPMPFPHLRDTYLVNLDRKVDLVTQYRAFTGAYVLHCHKLTHEDDGMMQLLRVCDPATDPTCGDYDWRSCAEGDLECLQALAATDCAMSGSSPAAVAACITALGGPGGICGADACVDDDDCGFPFTCQDNVCGP